MVEEAAVASPERGAGPVRRQPGDLRPRPLWRGQSPERGDIHFAVGLAKRSPFVSRAIAAGTASRTNHVGIITEVGASATDQAQPGGIGPDRWKIIEALSKGVIEDVHHPPPNSTVMRVSDDPAVRESFAQTAEAGLEPHMSYDWWAIGRIVFTGLLGRVPFLTFAVIGTPLMAAFVRPWWVTLAVVLAAPYVLYRIQPWLYEATRACPWPGKNRPDPHLLRPSRLICSAFGRYVIEGTFGGPDALPGLKDADVYTTSPGDLLQELLHRCDYWHVQNGTPTPRGLLDGKPKENGKIVKEPRPTVTRTR